MSTRLTPEMAAFAAAGHHHGIGHTHGHFQQLLHQQRAGQQQQFLFV